MLPRPTDHHDTYCCPQPPAWVLTPSPPQVPDQRAPPVPRRGIRPQHGAHRQDQLRGAPENQVGTGDPQHLQLPGEGDLVASFRSVFRLHSGQE